MLFGFRVFAELFCCLTQFDNLFYKIILRGKASVPFEKHKLREVKQSIFHNSLGFIKNLSLTFDNYQFELIEILRTFIILFHNLIIPQSKHFLNYSLCIQLVLIRLTIKC